jgi:hypothetical protein
LEENLQNEIAGLKMRRKKDDYQSGTRGGITGEPIRGDNGAMFGNG